MEYKILLSRDAEIELDSLPQEVRKSADHALGLLAKSPTRLSKSLKTALEVRGQGTFRGQFYEFESSFNGVDFYFTALFYYGSDEETLEVFAIIVEQQT